MTVEISAAKSELYGVPPEEFVAARSRLVADLDGDGARELKALRRPTVSAWAVNLLSRDGAVESLLDLGDKVRAAWSEGRRIAELEHDRAELVERLVRRGRELAEEHGRTLGDAAAREVEETLQATVAAAEAAQAVRGGCLSKPLRHAGFGDVAMGEPVESWLAGPKRPGTGPDTEAVREAERERLAESTRRAERALAEHEAELERLRGRTAGLDEEIQRVRSRLSELEKQRSGLDRDARAIKRERDQAARKAAAARRREADHVG